MTYTDEYYNEVLPVKQLGEKIGYGNLMYIASQLWKQDLKDHGYPENGAFVPALQSQIKTEVTHAVYFGENLKRVTETLCNLKNKDLNTSFTHTRPRPDTNPPSGRVTTKKIKNKKK